MRCYGGDPGDGSPAGFTNPEDVNLPLDITTVTHEHNDSTMKVDLFAGAGYEGKLEGKVEDTNDRELGQG